MLMLFNSGFRRLAEQQMGPTAYAVSPNCSFTLGLYYYRHPTALTHGFRKTWPRVEKVWEREGELAIIDGGHEVRQGIL